MWITHCTDMWQGIIWNQLSGYSQNGLRKGQGELLVPCRAGDSFNVSFVTCKPMTYGLAFASMRNVPTSNGDLPTSPVISWVLADGRRIGAVRATPYLALLEHLSGSL